MLKFSNLGRRIPGGLSATSEILEEKVASPIENLDLQRAGGRQPVANSRKAKSTSYKLTATS
jgi:hypothetical protein